MKIEIDEKVLARVCDAALRANGINAFNDVTLVTVAVMKATANSQNELDKKPLEKGKEEANGT